MPSAWLQPATLDEALGLRREHGDEALVLAGGTFVGILLSTGFLPPPPAFLALRDVPDLQGVRVDGGDLVLGAMATHRAVETDARVLEGWPALAACLRLVANERVRNQATIGGVLADADYASDPPALLSALAAEAVLAGPAGRRAVPVRDLIVDHYTTVIEPDELLVEVRVPPQPAVAAYRKFRSRHAEDRPCVGVALAAGRDGAGRVQGLRLVVGAVSGRPQELPEACALAEGRVLDEALAAEIARRYAAELDPIDDARGSSAYRRRIVEVEVRRALAGVAA